MIKTRKSRIGGIMDDKERLKEVYEKRGFLVSFVFEGGKEFIVLRKRRGKTEDVIKKPLDLILRFLDSGRVEDET